MSRITRLDVENIKKVKVVRIEPDGSIVRITGRNGQGKTTVLDSIMYVIGGERLLPEKPLRRGAKKGHIEVHFDDLGIIARRTFTEKGTDLVIESKDGAVYPSPQKMLDALLGKLSFDPLEFTRKKPAEQVETLLNMIDLKPDPKRLDKLAPGSAIEDPIRRLGARFKIEFEARTDKNKEAKLIEGELKAIPEPTDDDPKDAVNVAELVKKRDELKKEQQRQANVRAGVEQLRGKAGEIRAQIAKLQNEIKKLDAEAEAVAQRASDLDNEAAGFEDQTPAIAAHDDMIEDAQGVNERYSQVARWRETKTRHEVAIAASETLTKKLDEIRAYKEELVAGAEMPIPGLGFTDGAVTFNGDPLEQISQAEQIRVSVAIAAALNPKLKVMLVREGSLLDKASLELLAKLAEEKDLQVWLEQVDESRKVGVVIEDGSVLAVNPEKGGVKGSDADDEEAEAARG